jgi:hypothetical protein
MLAAFDNAQRNASVRAGNQAHLQRLKQMATLAAAFNQLVQHEAKATGVSLYVTDQEMDDTLASLTRASQAASDRLPSDEMGQCTQMCATVMRKVRATAAAAATEHQQNGPSTRNLIVAEQNRAELALARHRSNLVERAILEANLKQLDLTPAHAPAPAKAAPKLQPAPRKPAMSDTDLSGSSDDSDSSDSDSDSEDDVAPPRAAAPASATSDDSDSSSDEE